VLRKKAGAGATFCLFLRLARAGAIKIFFENFVLLLLFILRDKIFKAVVAAEEERLLMLGKSEFFRLLIVKMYSKVGIFPTFL
jgi:hypothetical protein